jgi:hypothetical protein
MNSESPEIKRQPLPLLRKKVIVFAFNGLILSIVMSLIMVEVGLRILDRPFPKNWEPAEYRRAQFDSVLGWSYIPSQSINQQFVYGQPEIAFHINDNGVRVGSPGESHDPKAPAVLFVGGSFTFGYGVPYEDSFPGQLSRNSDFNYQAVNLGVEAYGTDQALLNLKNKFNQYNTQAVVYTFIDNHVERNHNHDRRLLILGARFVGTKPLFGLNRDGALYLKKQPYKYEDHPDIRILNLLQIYQMRWGAKPTLDLTNALLQEMKEYVETNGATFILVYWNFGSEEEKKLLPMLEGLNTNLIDTADNSPLDWSAKGSQWQIPEDIHPSPKAHEYVAGLILEKFRQLDKLP